MSNVFFFFQAKMAVSEWTTQQVGKWLKDNNFREYVNLFCKDHKIDGAALLNLTEQDLREPPLEISVLGDIKRLGLAIRKLQIENAKGNNVTITNHLMIQSKHESFQSSDDSFRSASSSRHQESYARNSSRVDSLSSEYSAISDDDDDDDKTSLTSYESRDVNVPTKVVLQPEYIKLVLSCMYMFLVFLLTAFVMVIVNDRVPDMNKWPPLPDIILDNVPYIPWAFNMCEVSAISMVIVLSITLVLHKHR